MITLNVSFQSLTKYLKQTPFQQFTFLTLFYVNCVKQLIKCGLL